MLAVSLYSGFGITGQITAVKLGIKSNMANPNDTSRFIDRSDLLYTLPTSLRLLNVGSDLSLI